MTSAPDPVADAEDFSQDEGKSLAAIQAHEHGRGTADLRLLDQQRQFYRDRFRVGQVEVGEAVHLSAQVREGDADEGIPASSEPSSALDALAAVLMALSPAERERLAAMMNDVNRPH